jgi:nucleoside-diphosphate-sugar epimerase
MVAHPVEVIATAVDGTRTVLESARLRQSRGVVHLSSVEVYGQTRPGWVSETESGISRSRRAPELLSREQAAVRKSLRRLLG